MDRPGLREIRRALEEAIAGGPPGEAAYGRENLGRYVHTVEWILAGTPALGRLLDAGIYPAHLALTLARLGGFEISGVGRFVPPAFQRWMAERGIAVDDVDLERELLPHVEASFDRIVATEILEHLATPALFLSECWRVLRPGGVLYVTTPNVVDARGRAQALLGRSPQSHLFGIGRTFRMNEWVHRREYAPDEVGRLLEAVGFRVSGLRTWTPSRGDGGVGAGGWLAPLVNRLPGLGGTIFAEATRPAAAAGTTDRARIVPGCRYLEATPGSSSALTVRLTNIGTATWTPGSGPGAVQLGAHLAEPDGRVLERGLARAPLSGAVAPGHETALTLTFRAPAETGVFLLELDLVREGEHWFADDGSPAARVVLRVAA
ncbi:MAG TPA: methyltransferase domain-containing protein [Methylomirabilota bacterium]|jgi:SAM-dependent methyltransferase